MDAELVKSIAGPVLTAAVTGAGVALKQGWQGRDARQRARRRLRDATTEVTFIREWISAKEAALMDDPDTGDLALARESLRRIYDDVFVELDNAHNADRRSHKWTLRRVIYSAVALHIRVDKTLDKDTQAANAAVDGQADTYRPPRGAAAQAARVLYWFALAWALNWTIDVFADIPADGVSDVIGGTAKALFLTTVGAVLPAAAIRVVVLYLDKAPEEGNARERATRFASKSASRLLINRYAYATALSPSPLSVATDYTAWGNFIDRGTTGRHLAPADADALSSLPSLSDVNELFRRRTESRSTNTSVWFALFAQWFTDGFTTTGYSASCASAPNQEIDLCQIYGTDADRTQMLRSHTGGRLKSQLLRGAEFPMFLFAEMQPGEGLAVKPEFNGLFDQQYIGSCLGGASERQTTLIFAVGLARGNSTIGRTILNTVFLREHNRIADTLRDEHAEWDDDRLFETSRNVAIVLLIKILIEEFVQHLLSVDFSLQVLPSLADNERWNRPKRSTIEAELMYRWDMLIPDGIHHGSDVLPSTDLYNNNALVIANGVESLITQCSLERAGKICLSNTLPCLLESSQGGHSGLGENPVTLMRSARLRSYNEYRESYGLRRLTNFQQLTNEPALRERLRKLYDNDIDKLEWYVGIFAEEYADYAMMGELLNTMVLNDSFIRALTNPLLGGDVFNEETFSPVGMRIITETSSLQQIVHRNARGASAGVVSFQC